MTRLVLQRNLNQTVVIGGGMVTVTVVGIKDHSVRLSIDAPKELIVDRAEIHRKRVQEWESVK